MSRFIFRLETATGEGVYRHFHDRHGMDADLDVDADRFGIDARPIDCLTVEEYDILNMGDRERPVPYDDEGIGWYWIAGYHWSGFATITQARHWFDVRHVIAEFDADGVQLVAYLREHCDSLAYGQRQVIFHPKPDARPVRVPVHYIHELDAHELETMLLGLLHI